MRPKALEEIIRVVKTGKDERDIKLTLTQKNNVDKGIPRLSFFVILTGFSKSHQKITQVARRLSRLEIRILKTLWDIPNLKPQTNKQAKPKKKKEEKDGKHSEHVIMA